MQNQNLKCSLPHLIRIIPYLRNLFNRIHWDTNAGENCHVADDRIQELNLTDSISHQYARCIGKCNQREKQRTDYINEIEYEV